MNCFECDGKIETCPSYNNNLKQDFCTYKKIAQDDLRKFEKRESDITLGRMLEDYMGISLPEKVEIDALLN